MHFIALSLGSNLGDRVLHLAQARDALQQASFIQAMRCSSIYETAPLLPTDAPSDWDLPYLNQVVVGQTAWEPLAILTLTQTIEKQLGRVPAAHWAPRVIDIDLLMVGDIHYQDAQLTLPHAGLLERPFVLIPMAECVPEMIPVGAKATFKALANACQSKGVTLFSSPSSS